MLCRVDLLCKVESLIQRRWGYCHLSVYLHLHHLSTLNSTSNFNNILSLVTTAVAWQPNHPV